MTCDASRAEVQRRPGVTVQSHLGVISDAAVGESIPDYKTPHLAVGWGVQVEVSQFKVDIWHFDNWAGVDISWSKKGHLQGLHLHWCCIENDFESKVP